jgi:hypothetical protein
LLSTWQILLQPSPLSVLPSSHCSVPSSTPLPHVLCGTSTLASGEGSWTEMPLPPPPPVLPVWPPFPPEPALPPEPSPTGPLTVGEQAAKLAQLASRQS